MEGSGVTMDYSGQILDAVGEFRHLVGFAGPVLRVNGFYRFLVRLPSF
jgi:hypothetical protein